VSRQGRKLYVAIMDLRKAFNSVRRATLLNMLCSVGISNNSAVKAIYGHFLSNFLRMANLPICSTVLKVSGKEVR